MTGLGPRLRPRPGGLRILYVLPSLLTGGAESLVSGWARTFHQAGQRVEVCTLYTGGPFAASLESSGIPVHNLAQDPGIAQYRLRRKYDPRLVLRLSRLVQRGNYHLVHAHLFPAFLVTSLVARLVRGPAYLCSEHSIFNRRRRYPALKPIDRFLYHKYQRVLAVSSAVGGALQTWLPELEGKIQVMPNTVDADQFKIPENELQALRQGLDLQPNERVILFAGRFVAEKGPDVLVEALFQLDRLAGIRPGLPPVRILFAGEGPLKTALQSRCSLLTGPVQATFLGNRSDIPHLMNLADLVVLPSRWEGLPMILLEAMAAGKPVLATGVGGTQEVLTHADSGWIVSPDEPHELAEGMFLLLQSDSLRKQLGRNGYRKFEQCYSTRVILTKLEDIYASLVLGA